MAVLQLSIILYYDTLKILKSGLDKGPIILAGRKYRQKFDLFINKNGQIQSKKISDVEMVPKKKTDYSAC